MPCYVYARSYLKMLSNVFKTINNFVKFIGLQESVPAKSHSIVLKTIELTWQENFDKGEGFAKSYLIVLKTI